MSDRRQTSRDRTGPPTRGGSDYTDLLVMTAVAIEVGVGVPEAAEGVEGVGVVTGVPEVDVGLAAAVQGRTAVGEPPEKAGGVLDGVHPARGVVRISEVAGAVPLRHSLHPLVILLARGVHVAAVLLGP